jgi:hypothetical protein
VAVAVAVAVAAAVALALATAVNTPCPFNSRTIEKCYAQSHEVIIVDSLYVSVCNESKRLCDAEHNTNARIVRFIKQTVRLLRQQ